MSSLFTDWIEGFGIELMLFGLAWLGWNLATRHLQRFFDLRLRIRRHIERMADAEAPKRPAAASAETAAAAPEREPANAAEIAGALGFELLRFAHRAPLSARVSSSRTVFICMGRRPGPSRKTSRSRILASNLACGPRSRSSGVRRTKKVA